jgi:hypothetical protein
MNGKLVSGSIVVFAGLFGAAMYYQQVYGFYREVPATGVEDVQIVTLADGIATPIDINDFQAIDADSSPIRYRACFTTPLALDDARALYVAMPDAQPLNAPGWFDCFDAAAIGAELEAGTTATFLSAKNIAYGVDRVVAITSDGRGFTWHILNDCGTKVYDGTVVGEECPARPDVKK